MFTWNTTGDYFFNGVFLGWILGNAFAYFFLVLPIIKVKDRYINRLNERLKNK